MLDPLCGVGGSLLGAALCDREALEIEINQQWIDIYKQVARLENLKEFSVLLGDANDKLKEIDRNSVDFVLTDVPYWIMDKLEKTRSKSSIRGSKLTKFNDKDLQSKEDWLSEMKQIFINVALTLKDNGYMAVFIGDMYRGKEFHFLSADLAKSISEISGFTLKADILFGKTIQKCYIFTAILLLIYRL